jgi:hypothetical protein
MLRGRDLKVRSLDQCAQVLSGEPAYVDAPALGLHVELRLIDEASSGRIEDPNQAAWRKVMDVRPSSDGHHTALTLAGPGQSNIRMTLTIYTRPQKACRTPRQAP